MSTSGVHSKETQRWQGPECPQAGRGSICPDFPLCYTSFSGAPPPPSGFGFRVFRKLGVNSSGRLTLSSPTSGAVPASERGKAGARAGSLCCWGKPDHRSAPHAEPETPGGTPAAQMPARNPKPQQLVLSGDAVSVSPSVLQHRFSVPNPTKLCCPLCLPWCVTLL